MSKYAILIISVSAAFLLALLGGCSHESDAPKSAQDTLKEEHIPDQIAWNIDILFLDSNYTKAKLKAHRARVYNKLYKTILDGGVYAEFLSKTSGARTTWFVCDSLVIDDKTKNMFGYRNVKVVSDSSHAQLETSELTWLDADQKIVTDKYVKIQTPREFIEGIGLESDANLLNYQIFKVSGIKK